MNARRIFGLVSAAILIVTSVASAIFWVRLPGRLPTDADYRRANELIAARAQPGDIAVFAPAYADRGRAFITAVPAYSGYDLKYEEYPGTKRQWLVALADAPRFSLQDAIAAMGAGNGAGERIGGLYVQLFDKPGPPVAFSFTEEIAKATVTVGSANPRPCPLDGRGVHRCSREDWNKVGAAWYDVNERPLRCVWAHPVGREPLRIAFAGVPLRGKLRGRGAFVGQSAAGNGAPVDMAVEINGQPFLTRSFENAFGQQWFDKPFPVAEGPYAEPVTITFSISTANSGLRHFCFDAWEEAPPVAAASSGQ